MGIAGIIIFIIIAFALGFKTAIGFLIGAAASFAAGYIGMRVSVIANVRTAEAAKGGLAKGLSSMVCISAPAMARPAPTTTAISAVGMRMTQTITRVLAGLIPGNRSA